MAAWRNGWTAASSRAARAWTAWSKLRGMPDAPAPAPFWQKCSLCKKPIQFRGPYFKCVVSTCNRKRFQLYFCSDECWDAHNPDQNHRNPGYTEHVAPAS